jgi:hypothetical protein
MNLQLCPLRPARAPGAPAPRPARATWPRLYARHLPTGQVFELTRGEDLPADRTLAEMTAYFGRAWQIWPEHALPARELAVKASTHA